MTPLSELCIEIVDCEHKTAPKTDDVVSYPLVRTTDIGRGRIDLTGAHRVDAVTYAEWTRRAEPQPGDLILAREAPVGNVGLITPGMEPVLGQRTVLIRPDEDKVDPQFLTYRLLAHDIQHWMSGVANGATVPHLNMEDIRALPIPELPPLQAQRQIGARLSAFDDLIENNRRRIEILEEMARLLYREWFVYFRFPGHEDVELVDSDLGPIPDGWAWRNLFDLAEVGFGFSFKSKRFAESGKFRVIRIRDVPKNTTGTFTDEDAGERYEVQDGDTLIGMDGDFHMCRWADGLAYLNQRVARIRTKGQLSQLHLHLALEQPIRRFNETIIGTTVAHLGKRHLEEIWVAEPPPLLLAAATQHLYPMFELELNLRKQNGVLREARDLLLPRLVAGELDVSEIDLGLEAVGT